LRGYGVGVEGLRVEFFGIGDDLGLGERELAELEALARREFVKGLQRLQWITLPPVSQ
jgi:hypothetical protein